MFRLTTRRSGFTHVQPTKNALMLTQSRGRLESSLTTSHQSNTPNGFLSDVTTKTASKAQTNHPDLYKPNFNFKVPGVTPESDTLDDWITAVNDKGALQATAKAETQIEPAPKVVPDETRPNEVSNYLSQETNTIGENGHAYWAKIPRWSDVNTDQFMSYAWQTRNNVQTKKHMQAFLNETLPEIIPNHEDDAATSHIKTRDDFIEDVFAGMDLAPMSIRLTPHILSVMDWSDPLNCPIRRQFIPMKSLSLPDHPSLTLDSLHETDDSPVEGLVHRYPDKVLFLAVSVCPVYCRFCTRSYAVGADTEGVTKESLKPTRKRWEAMYEYIRNTPAVNDVVISGGDSYYLQPQQLHDVCKTLLDIPNVRRIRIATKGLAVCPSRIMDPNDQWTDELIWVSNYGRKMGKTVAIHTHFNHPNEITWITKVATQKLFAAAVTVRNQAVLIRGVNDNLETMSALIRDLSDINVLPYYVYQHDMVKGVEDLRTPLYQILELEAQIRGSIAGFLVPSFVVDLPGGGGKRLAASYQSYDRATGVSKFMAPAVKGGQNVYEYHDPLWSLPKNESWTVGGFMDSVNSRV